MIILAAAMALSGQALTLPGDLPVYCLAANGDYHHIRETDLARLKAAVTSQFRFTSALTSTGPDIGLLQFKGGSRDSETITYDIAAHEDGIALLAMRVRLRGVTENVNGDDMCWRTFRLIEPE